MGSNRRFEDIKEVSAPTRLVLDSLGFKTATPVQAAVIPLFTGHKDVSVDACTGSGKTLAFVIPIVEKLRKLEEPLGKHQVGAVIVSPTRELARQIATVAEPFLASLSSVRAQLLVGGTDPAADVAAFKETGAQVLVGTPGRILDVMKRCTAMDLRRLEVLVLDEADRLLDMGFRTQLDAIMAQLPKQRRTGLFSATQTEAVQALARAGLRNPVRVNVAVSAMPGQSQAASGALSARKSNKDGSAAAGGGEDAQATEGGQKTPAGLQISYAVAEADQKLDQLVRFLQLHGSKQKVIVYGLTCACVDFYALALARLQAKHLPGVQIKPLHGKLKQAQREATLEAFSKLEAGVLLATDLAARGLDIPAVHWVVQLDPPQDPDAFVHRVGRTARAGSTGSALVYLTPAETAYVDFLRLRKVPMRETPLLEDAPSVLPVLRHEAETDRQVMELGMRAFVSYIRGYNEHHCKYIFRVQDLHLGRMATSFALLRLPHMPEVKKAIMKYKAVLQAQTGADVGGLPQLEHFVPSQVDPDSVKYKDKAREKQRQKALKEKEAQAGSKPAKGQQAQGQQGAKAQAPAAQQQHQSGERLTAQKRRKLQARDEAKELEEEYKLLKKLKRGKISEKQYDRATGLVAGSSSDDDSDVEMEDEADEAAHGSDRPSGSQGAQAGAGSKAGQGKKGAAGGPGAASAGKGKGALETPGSNRQLLVAEERRGKKAARKAKKKKKKQKAAAAAAGGPGS